MTDQIQSALVICQNIVQRVTFAVLVGSAVVLSGLTLLAAAGLMPWLEFSAVYGGTTYENAGQIAQIAMTALAVMLCFFLPGNRRVMQLENSHRRFFINMQDVARAYAAAHAADRQGLFRLSAEFDSVRERLAYLREHPDLAGLEPGLLEVAAQMSQISRELAVVYNDEKVTRARAFLRQRQEEIESFNARLERARLIVEELKRWSHQVEIEEALCQRQIEKLSEELLEVLPEVAPDYEEETGGTVVKMNPKKMD